MLPLLAPNRMFEKYQRFWIRPLNPPILGDFEPSSPQSWGVRGAAIGTFQTTSKNDRGFTLLETITVTVIVGVLAIIAGPSLIRMYEGNKVQKALDQVQAALRDAQKQAIRKSQTCTITLNPSTTPPITASSADCLVGVATDDRSLPDNVSMAVNATSGLNITFSFKGTVTMKDGTTDLTVPGTIVLSSPAAQDKRCVVIYNPLGITRSGFYTGTGTPSEGSCNKSAVPL